ncbi:hypothetical protein GWK47_052322 [Chionoecetes opilio]|uniref:Uncharacterized protein n=1 Tax=Chionoecetes opilio TaxID=41210 RepID=A0A8J4Y1G0_CHIOP|nr:hypothetical protein GWK47_052322 [Chionoecetes opilio]
MVASLVRSSLTRSGTCYSLSDAVLVASRQFKEMLNRGKLTKPSDFSLNIVREICFMWRALMMHLRRQGFCLLHPQPR